MAETLRTLGLGGGQPGASGTAVGQLPPPVREQLAGAAAVGFHDTIWLLVALGALGLGAALLLRDRAPGGPPANEQEGSA